MKVQMVHSMYRPMEPTVTASIILGSSMNLFVFQSLTQLIKGWNCFQLFYIGIYYIYDCNRVSNNHFRSKDPLCKLFTLFHPTPLVKGWNCFQLYYIYTIYIYVFNRVSKNHFRSKDPLCKLFVLTQPLLLSRGGTVFI